jgi:hypothetical protein
MGGSWFKASLAKNVIKILPQNTSWAWWLTFVIPAMQEVELGGSLSKAGPTQKHETLSEK